MAGTALHPSARHLERMMKETRSVADQTLADLGAAQRSAQWILDETQRALPLLPYLPPSEFEDKIDGWIQVDAQARQLGEQAATMRLNASMVNSTSGTFVMSMLSTVEKQPQAFGMTPAGILAKRTYMESSTRSSRKDEVVNLMRTLRLDVSPAGKESPLQLFERAHGAFESPPPRGHLPTAVLITVREAIRSSIKQLLNSRRPTGGALATGGNESAKISSIAKHLGYPGLNSGTVETWTTEWVDLLRMLDTAKDATLERPEVGRRLGGATLFLYSFLSGLDASRLPPPRATQPGH